MNNPQVNQAIEAALNQKWDDAVNLNQEILKTTPKDIDALNRLGRAYIELGKYSSAKEVLNRVIKLDQYNKIAIRNLQITSTRKINPSCNKVSIDPNLFLEEPGKTRTATLLELADKRVISALCLGEEVKLVVKKHFVVVTSNSNEYLGKLAEDLSLRLAILIKGGNCYQAHIKSSELNEVKIFIRQVSTSKKYANFPSFPPQELAYQAFIPPNLVHDERPDVSGDEEDANEAEEDNSSHEEEENLDDNEIEN